MEGFKNVPLIKEGTLLHNLYFISSKIGEGAFGRVYKAFKKDTEEVVAIKQTLKSALEQEPKLQQLYNSEVSILKSINNENVVKYIDSFNTKDSCFLVLEYCNQGELSQMLRKYKRFSEEIVIEYLKQILNGFKALHKNQIVHRDFKLDNILINQLQLKIADLGFAAEIKNDPRLTVLGTPTTMAPEILQRKPYGLEVDVFSLGIVIYQMLYGEYPYRADVGNLEERIEEFIRKIKYEVPGVKISNEMKSLLQRMICYSRAKRIKWHEIYQLDILNTKQSIKSKLFTQSMIRMPSNKDESIKLYEQFKHLYIGDSNVAVKFDQVVPITDICHQQDDSYDVIDPTSQTLLHYEKLKQDKLRKESIIECVQLASQSYIHYKCVYSQLYYTINSITQIPREARNHIVLFLLSKKAHIMAKEMDDSLRQKINIFNIKYFNEFLMSENFKEINSDFIGHGNDFQKLYSSTRINAQNILRSLEDQKKTQLAYLLKEEIKQELQLTPNFNNLLKLALAYSYQKLESELQLCTSEKEKSNYFYQLMMSLDLLEQDELFKDVMFDFLSYNYQIFTTPLPETQLKCQQKAQQHMLCSLILS